MGRLHGVEGLRGVAALAVLAYHVWLFGPLGHLALPGPAERVAADLRFGLILFFVLSGFLLFRPFAAAALTGSSRPRTRAYLTNRALRILPAYWAILLLVGFVLQSAVLDGRTTTIGGPPSLHLLLADMLLVQDYDPGTLATGIGPAWSPSWRSRRGCWARSSSWVPPTPDRSRPGRRRWESRARCSCS